MKPKLDNLFGPCTIEDFFENYFRRRPLHVPGSPDKLETLLGFRPDAAWLVDQLSKDEKKNEQLLSTVLFLKDQGVARSGGSGDRRQEVRATLSHRNTIEVIAHEIRGLLFNVLGLDVADPRLSAFCVELQRYLGLPAAASTQCFYTPGMAIENEGKALHFDHPHTFFVQVVGKRTFSIQDGVAVQDPTDFGRLTEDGRLVVRGEEFVNDDAVSEHWGRHSELALKEITLNEGDVLYFPGGCLHQTSYAQGERSMGIAFALWADTVQDFASSLLFDLLAKDIEGWKSPYCANRTLDTQKVQVALDELIKRIEFAKDPEVLSLHYSRRRAALGNRTTLTGKHRSRDSRVLTESEAKTVDDFEIAVPDEQILVVHRTGPKSVTLMCGSLEAELDIGEESGLTAFERLAETGSLQLSEFLAMVQDMQREDVVEALFSLESDGIVQLRKSRRE